MEETKVEETKEVKSTYKKHGPLYWLIIIVGMTFIVFMSVRMGEKIAKEKIDKEDGGKKTTITSNSNSNVAKSDTLSVEEALNIGRDLYKKATVTYPSPLSGALESKCTDLKSSTAQGLEQYDCTSLYNELKTIYVENNEVFKNFRDIDGKYIYLVGGIGFVGKVTTTLSVKSIETDKIVFMASIDLYNEPDKSTNQYNEEFIIVKENDTWKISTYEYTLGSSSNSEVK